MLGSNGVISPVCARVSSVLWSITVLRRAATAHVLWLCVTVIAGTNFHEIKEKKGVPCHVAVKAQIGSTSYKTGYHMDASADPLWRQCFRFDLTGKETNCNIEVHGKSSVIGKVRCDSSALNCL